LAPAERLSLESMPSFAMSPDGTRIVIATERQGSSQLHLRRLDRFDHAPIPGTEGATGPFFSPDGEWVGFFAAGKLKKAPLAGGPPVILCEALNPRGGAWASDGSIVFSAGPGFANGLSRVSAGGGKPQALTTPDARRGVVLNWFDELVKGPARSGNAAH
jgi:Tol biopolymer transport system component